MNTESTNNWGFTVRPFDAPETQHFLRSILRQDSCVPFIGAGFTRGENARSAKVPGGEEWIKLMKQQIQASDFADKPTDIELEDFGFQELSDIYFREKIVPLETIKESVNSCFTNVKINDEAKMRFLSIDWPYIYTLNIDDGIERAIDGIKVLPYKDFSRYHSRRYVYKIHGDADDVLTAASHDDLQVIFGKADYINSLNKNQYFISSLVNDFCEKNILFIGCSLSDELDISFALANVSPEERISQTARIFITSEAPSSYSEKKKLKSYGITDVIVTDYFTFYNFAASIAEPEDNKLLAISSFEYSDKTNVFSNEKFVSYILQSGWEHSNNPYSLSIQRTVEQDVHHSLTDPLVVIWGRRFSGKSTLLHRVLSKVRTRKRFIIQSQVSISDRAFNEIFQVEDSLIAIDSGVLHYNQLRELARKIDTLKENNTTVLLAIPRADLNALGYSYADESIEVDQKLRGVEVTELNKLLDPMGFMHWEQSKSILDNVFTLGSTSIAAGMLKSESNLDKRISAICSSRKTDAKARRPSKIEFSLLFYLTIRQRIYSFVHHTLLKKYGVSYLSETNMENFSANWAPFIEMEETDPVSRRAESSASVLVCNSYAWTQLAVRRFSDEMGVEDTASFIAELYKAVCDIDNESHKLILFDNLNAVYSPKKLNEKDWGALVITAVYEKLAGFCAQKPDYWLQRAKGVYYLSGDEQTIRIAIEYCEKSIVEKAEKTAINAKLTKANLLGKLCEITNFSSDDDLSKAVTAYADAIKNRDSNSSYISELLRKNQKGLGYMSNVCNQASKRMNLLKKRDEIRFITGYL